MPQRYASDVIHAHAARRYLRLCRITDRHPRRRATSWSPRAAIAAASSPAISMIRPLLSVKMLATAWLLTGQPVDPVDGRHGIGFGCPPTACGSRVHRRGVSVNPGGSDVPSSDGTPISYVGQTKTALRNFLTLLQALASHLMSLPP